MSPQNFATRLIALLALGAALTGCSSNKPKPAAAAPPPPPATLGQIKTDLLNAKAQINATTEAVNALGKSTDADAQANYNRFASEYAKLNTMADTNRARVADLKKRTQEYYDAWSNEAEIQNPELKRRVLQQRADAEKIYSNIKSDLELGKLAFDPYMSNLKDVESYLRGNLSPARIATASDLIAKANEDGKAVEMRIDAVVVEIDKMMAASGDAQPAVAP